MKVKVFGVQNVDYVSKRTNEPVKGRTFHCIFKDPQVVGDAVDAIFVSDRLSIPGLYDIQPGAALDIEYNSRGSVCGVQVMPK
ncbi:hypothetical protein B5E84_00605 [Lachnoclostridium sp. An14]|uniref:hypothetical protein n=1 Tax=Lachnoclostridium sp. An14 TaxID=1965562 RepID=UPI000B375D9B|nr:hypothetical protein [Lachnoclostridium sp. An14]OUQ21797.1 hypothetical protein B5E84_00605 [Lachnoclostridium sp. An14]